MVFLSHRGLFLSVITVLEFEMGLLLMERREPAQGAVRVVSAHPRGFNYRPVQLSPWNR